MEIKISTEALRKKKLFIGTPCYGGQMSSDYFISSIDMVNRFNELGMSPKFAIISNESLVPRARGNLAHMFLQQKEFTHFLQIDADIKFKVDDVLTLLALCDENQYQVICGSYPKKSINWSLIKEAVKAGVEPKDLSQYMDNPVMNLVGTDGPQRLDLSKPVEVLDTGTGFMMIHRTVLEKMREAHPELVYTPDYALSNPAFDAHRSEGVCAFFDTMIVTDETTVAKKKAGVKRYLSEDYAFCHLWRQMGGKVWLAPWLNLGHNGSFQFKGNLAATMGLRSVTEMSKGVGGGEQGDMQIER